MKRQPRGIVSVDEQKCQERSRARWAGTTARREQAWLQFACSRECGETGWEFGSIQEPSLTLRVGMVQGGLRTEGKIIPRPGRPHPIPLPSEWEKAKCAACRLAPGGGSIGLQNPLPRLILLIFAVGRYHSKIARCVSARPDSRAWPRADRLLCCEGKGAQNSADFVRGS
jgi:hypothetical protein